MTPGPGQSGSRAPRRSFKVISIGCVVLAACSLAEASGLREAPPLDQQRSARTNQASEDDPKGPELDLVVVQPHFFWKESAQEPSEQEATLAASLLGFSSLPTKSASSETSEPGVRVFENGMEVRVREGLTATFRTKPYGTAIAWLREGDRLILESGPRILKGRSQPIFWWRVSNSEGLTGWVAANTSELAVLERVPD